MKSFSSEKNIVYYDGSCPMCRAIINTIDNSTKRRTFVMHDITKEPTPQSLTRSDVEKEIQVIADGKIYKNAEAILKILEAYPAWRFFVWVGQLPIVRQLLTIGYNFIATNRHFLFGSASRIYWLKVVIGLGFICELLFSPRLWVSSRSFPLTPVLSIFPTIPYPIDWVMLCILFLLLVFVILTSKPKPYIWASIVVVSILVFLDQQRLQPWVYQYTCMFVALGFFSWKWDDTEARNTILNICRFMVASIYFWSGVQKINPEFVNGIFPQVVSPIAQLFPIFMQPVFHDFGMAVPFIELGIGIGLLTRKLRPLAIVLSLVMCVFILWTLGPLGRSWNSIVWPWNVTMVALVLLLFAKTRTVSIRHIAWIQNSILHKAVLVIFGILPLLYFFNLWDSYVSWSLYSGTTNESVIYMSNYVTEQLPNNVQQLVHTDTYGNNMLSIADWTLAELNVPPYPETRIFKNVAQSICKLADDPHEVTLVMRGRLSWFRQDGRQVLDCSQLYEKRSS